jgi:hypothetical protein
MKNLRFDADEIFNLYVDMVGDITDMKARNDADVVLDNQLRMWLDYHVNNSNSGIVAWFLFTGVYATVAVKLKNHYGIHILSNNRYKKMINDNYPELLEYAVGEDIFNLSFRV